MVEGRNLKMVVKNVVFKIKRKQSIPFFKICIEVYDGIGKFTPLYLDLNLFSLVEFED